MKQEVTDYILKKEKWQAQLTQLRQLLLDTEMQECIKWGMPTYMIGGKNVVSFSGFKNHCGLWFYNGNLLEDNYNILSNAQEGKTKSMRHYKIYEGDMVDTQKIRSYINEAVENEKEGRVTEVQQQQQQVKSKPEKAFDLDINLKNALDKNVALKKKFLKLTKIQQRDYSVYITEAKRQATKLSRIEKIIPLIAEGKGLSHLWAKK